MIERYCGRDAAHLGGRSEVSALAQVELAVCDALADAGRIPREAVATIREGASM